MLAELLNITQTLHSRFSNRTPPFLTDRMQCVLPLGWLLLIAGKSLSPSLYYWWRKWRQQQVAGALGMGAGSGGAYRGSLAKLPLHFGENLHQ